MSFCGNFRHDLFISYAHADDVEGPVGGQWVSTFVVYLERALRQRLGGPTELDIYFDRRNLTANHQLSELLEEIRSSAIFVAVASRSYAVRPWTRQELQTFASRTTNLKRLFAVECLPLDANDSYPKPLDTHKRMQFWRIDEPGSLAPIPISPTFEANIFFQRIHDLAEQIRLELVATRNTAAASKAVNGSSYPAERHVERPQTEDLSAGRLLLAQVTDDLEEERDQVRRYLEQFRIEVFPQGGYPQGGSAFMTAFESDLARTDMVVQLLGPSGGRRPPDLAKGYTHYQHETAVRRGVRILQWRQPNLDLAAVANADYKSLLASETVLATGLESFKAEIMRQLRLPLESGAKARPGLVFIDADRKDLSVAEAVHEELKRHRISSVVATFDGPAEAIRIDLEENLIECDGLVVVYGDTSHLWVRTQLRLFSKMSWKRTAPPKVLAICVGPPTKDGPLGFSLANAQEIYFDTTWEMKPLQKLISELSR